MRTYNDSFHSEVYDTGADPSLEDVYNNMSPPMTRDQWHIHDPSHIVATDGMLMIAVTGKAQEDGYKLVLSRLVHYYYHGYRCGLETWYLAPGQTDWQPGQCLFTSKPAWIDEELPSNDGAFWAPALLSPRLMYYSVAAMDEDAQCIGLAMATGTAPDLTWIDSGNSITCSFDPESNDDVNMPNSIDPATFIDEDGSHHLLYGGGRIWTTELDPVTGDQIEGNWWDEEDPAYHYLARGPDSLYDPGEVEWIEASYMHKNSGYYYLFVNWFGCCDGVDSTYEIHVGRGDAPTGPFVDKDGVDMTQGGGSLLLAKSGRYIGPGHAGVFSEGGRDWFSFHYYDGDRDGLPWVEVRRMVWEEGWPRVTEERFNATAYFEQ